MSDAIRILEGDNNTLLCALFNAGERFTLAYLDPPFHSGKQHKTDAGEVAFDDRWPSRGLYLEKLRVSACSAWSLILPGGSLVVHLDPTIVHYVKVMLDETIGVACFAGEIIWRYRRWPSKTRNFQSMHDVLLRYVADPHVEPRFNQLYEPIAASTMEQWGTGKQRAVRNQSGRRVRSTTTEEPALAPLSDVWDVGRFSPSSAENTGYPTQKPERLLARLVDALTNVGESVIDPYMGSGTMEAVCAKRDRTCVGIDESPVAVRTAKARLEPLLRQRSLFEKVGT